MRTGVAIADHYLHIAHSVYNCYRHLITFRAAFSSAADAALRAVSGVKFLVVNNASSAALTMPEISIVFKVSAERIPASFICISF
jgi:hypothetical protein